MKNIVADQLSRYDNIIEQQIFLQEQGVSFEYSDKISYFERTDIVQRFLKRIEDKNKKQEEEMAKARASG